MHFNVNSSWCGLYDDQAFQAYTVWHDVIMKWVELKVWGTKKKSLRDVLEMWFIQKAEISHPLLHVVSHLNSPANCSVNIPDSFNVCLYNMLTVTLGLLSESFVLDTE